MDKAETIEELREVVRQLHGTEVTKISYIDTFKITVMRMTFALERLVDLIEDKEAAE